MIPVDQTIFDAERGDCFRACVASILEMPLSEVPHFCAPEVFEWWNFLLDWSTNRGLVVETFGPLHGEHMHRWKGSRFGWSARRWDGRPPSGCAILVGTSPRYAASKGQHAVVCVDGAMVHDPHPDRSGVLDVTEWITIRPGSGRGAR